MSGEWPKEFDLNMEEELLEAWEVSDGIRELIANALDESELSEITDPDISQDEQGRWHIRDYGRGLTHQDLTQGEDEEKLNNPDKVIGKFGVGLKDALAVLYRHDVNVTIHSPYISFTVEQASKAGFDDVETLH
ncbi:ATP-binding protein, partial [Natrinema pallidum]|uniref:ATP-binding protein n=1 Tax=Natrinema pallidum TaxID=69527 RepID=UPI00373AEE43